jgi:hypothetical protein
MSRKPTSSFQPFFLAIIVVAHPGSAAADQTASVTVLQESPLSSPRREELGMTLVVQVKGISVELLSQCIAHSARPLERRLSPEQIFGGVSWTLRELKMLRDCNTDDCEYEFPSPSIQRLMQGSTLVEKKRIYYRLIFEHTLSTEKKKKDHRIYPYEATGEPCAAQGAFHWLLDGRLKPQDPLVWKKISPSARMQPTIMTQQVAGWSTGQTLCVGRTMLFADHYYDDHLELFQLQPASGNNVKLRYHSRSTFDFFDAWLARRMRGTIDKGLREYERQELVQLLGACVYQHATAKQSGGKNPK